LQQPDWFLNPEVKSAAAAFRATVPDHLPLAGALQANQLYVLGAMGARGILLSPLLAELVACQICKDPLPLAQELVNRIRADRFR